MATWNGVPTTPAGWDEYYSHDDEHVEFDWIIEWNELKPCILPYLNPSDEVRTTQKRGRQ